MKRTFGGIPLEFDTYDNAAILLQAFPYDDTSTWGKGADQGYDAFLEAAENMELYDIETDSEVYLKGIHLCEPKGEFSSPEQMHAYTYQRAKRLLETNKFLTFFGGEHSISIGIIKAFQEHYTNLSVLHLDAHADLRPNYMGSKFNHACAMYNANENGNVVQVGIRSMDSSEKKYLNSSKAYFAHEVNSYSGWISDSIDQLTDNVYISLDLDVLDPSIMPATGTPEPGGLSWRTLVSYLEEVFSEKNVVGFDIVELAPILGFSAPQFLTAKLYYKMLSYKFHGS